MQAVILAAGEGTRLRPLTLTKPKPLIKIANKSILEHNLEQLTGMVDEAIIVIGYKSEMIKESIGDFFKGIKITYVLQEQQLGTGHALFQAEHLVKDKFIAFYGDDLYFRGDMEKLLVHDYALLAKQVDDIKKFGEVVVDGHVKEIKEKPQSPKSNLANMGVYFLDKKIFVDVEKSQRNEYELTDMINVLAKKEKISCVVAEKWLPIGYPWHILEANTELLKNGSVIGENVVIRPGAYIEEPVAIGDGSVLGPNCFIRKYSTIGKNCKIGNAVEIKNSVIGDNSFISHLSYVGDSIIGDNCNIGAGAIFANLRLDDKSVKMSINADRVDTGKRKLGGIVSDGAKLGVNVTVMPGKKIWPNLLVPACITIKDDITEQLELK